ncbi:MAG: VOC family protein, partial [Dongiales bacterium]
MLTRIHHVGVAVADLDESIGLYRAALGAELVHRQVNDKEGLEAAFLRTGDGEVELMSPTREDSPVGKFLAKRGPGLHHVAYGVTDIRKALADARAAGLEL